MCTTTSYLTAQNHVFLARTQDFQYNLPWRAIFSPRGQRYPMEGMNPIESKYASIAIGTAGDFKNDFSTIIFSDGVNEKGLAGATSYFDTYYKFASPEAVRAAGKTPIRPDSFIMWALCNCESVADVLEQLDGIACANIPNPGLGFALPQHFFLRDRTGRCVVIEPSVECGFAVYENPVGVLSNSPAFDWQMVNLSNYLHLSNQNCPDGEINGHKLPSLKGTGQLGLPGDYTAGSRFVRAAFLVDNLCTPVDDDEGMRAGFHIMATLNVPKGAIMLANDVPFYTQYTVVTNVESQSLFIRFYDNTQVFRFDLADFDLNGQEPQLFPFDLKEEKIPKVNA